MLSWQLTELLARLHTKTFSIWWQFCWPLSEQAPKRDTKDLGKCELAGACRGVNVPLQPL